MQQKFSEREVHNDKCLLQETRTISNEQPNFTLQGTRKIKTNEAQSQQVEGDSKCRVEINRGKNQSKTKTRKINEIKSWFSETTKLMKLQTH